MLQCGFVRSNFSLAIGALSPLKSSESNDETAVARGYNATKPSGQVRIFQPVGAGLLPNSIGDVAEKASLPL